MPFLLLGFYNKLGWGTAFGFLIGAVLSAAAGFIGMNVAVRSNARTAEAARGGLAPALNVAFRAGSVTGLLVVGLGLFGVAGYYWFLTGALDNSPTSAIDDLVGLAFGGSLISVFARLGGGIFTKAADVGADLVGKIEAGIPEDDPRNPAVIADNVGDNVGDCAGMAADLFETYAVTAVAVMLLGTHVALVGDLTQRLYLYPLALGGVSIDRLGDRHVLRAARQRRERRSSTRSTRRCSPRPFSRRSASSRSRSAFDGGRFAFSDLYLSALVGLVVTFLLVAITEYYTGTRWNPVKAIAKASQTGHATNIIEGLAIGMQATALPVIVIVAGILVAHHFAGLYGIGVAVMAQLSMTGLIVALDAYGPVTDNAGGIAEMADLPAEVRGVTDPLDAVGNTTKAVTKGYAIGSAALAALSCSTRTRRASPTRACRTLVLALGPVGDRRALHRRPDAVPVRVARDAGGRARRRRGRQEVRRQFREHPGIMEGTARPDYSRAVGIVTALGDQARCCCRPLIPIGFPIVVGIISAKMLGGLLIGTIVTGLFLAIAMTSGGGAWDNAKKLIEDGAYGGKGSEAHAAVGHRRHRRRSVQGHRRPGDQPDDQDHEHRRDPDHPADRLDPRLATTGSRGDRGREAPRSSR